MIVALTVKQESKDTRFYLDSMAEVYMCYDKSLFSIYNLKNLPSIRTADLTELKVLGKGMIPLDVLIDGKSELVNFCNVFYTPELEYDLLSVGTNEKAGYWILAKNGNMIVCDIKDNVAIEASWIGTSYLVNVPASKETLALASLYSVPHSHILWKKWH